MHPSAMESMAKMLERVKQPSLKVLDVGSYNVNGTYRTLIETYGWQYLGIDIMPGSNVDRVVKPYNFDFPDNSFDIIISGSTMEHVEKPWLWIPELARVLRPGGLLAILTHWQFPLHRHPVDTFRYLPDGMKVLFDETKSLEDYDIQIVNDTDIAASAYKKYVTKNIGSLGGLDNGRPFNNRSFSALDRKERYWSRRRNQYSRNASL